jgi:protein-disulfide isomerase
LILPIRFTELLNFQLRLIWGPIARHSTPIITVPRSIISAILILATASSAIGTQSAGDLRTHAPADHVLVSKSLGSRSAPIVIEEFTDFQCPACRNQFSSSTTKLIEEYVDTGKVYLVHHDYPLLIHIQAYRAACWADAAALIGKFKEVETALFLQQDSWSSTGNVEAVLISVLSQDEMKRVKELMNSSEVVSSIEHDIELGHQLDVRGTPRMFMTVHGRSVTLPVGRVGYPRLKQLIDELLKTD